ncbi:MAG: hypothetical protein KC519_06855, partial [Anaerolineae bacterium]|nr:hypothetical protein [Anaerolineae bacterium]
MLGYLREESLSKQQDAAGSSTGAALLKKQSDVIEKLRAELDKVALEIDKKQLAGALALDADGKRYDTLLESLHKNGFSVEDRKRLNSVMVTLDTDIDRVSVLLERAKKKKLREETRHKKAAIDEEAAKARLEMEMA